MSAIELKHLLFGCVLLLCLTECSKPVKPIDSSDEYYVKYVFCCEVVQYGKSYSTPYSVTFIDSFLKQQIRNYKTIEKEEIVCGPFSYGDKIGISLEHYYHDNVGGSSQAQSIIEVYLSKNNSPFSLRKTESSFSQEPYTTSLEYIIDY